MKKKYFFIGLGIIVVGFLIFLWRQQPQPGEIPAEYHPLYSELENKLDDFDKYLESLSDKEDMQKRLEDDIKQAEEKMKSKSIDPKKIEEYFKQNPPVVPYEGEKKEPSLEEQEYYYRKYILKDPAVQY